MWVDLSINIVILLSQIHLRISVSIINGLVEPIFIIFWGTLLACHLSWLPDLLSRLLHSDLDLRRYTSVAVFVIWMRIIVISPRWPLHMPWFYWVVLKAIRVIYLSLFYWICILICNFLFLETSRWLFRILVVHRYFRHLIHFVILNIFFSYVLCAWLLFKSICLLLFKELLSCFEIDILLWLRTLPSVIRDRLEISTLLIWVHLRPIFMLEALLLRPTIIMWILLLLLLLKRQELASHSSLLVILKHKQWVHIRFELPNWIPPIISILPLLYLLDQTFAHVF